MSHRAGFTALLVVAAVVFVTVPAGALPAMSADASVAAQEGDRNASNASNASFGASVSGFMQASAADAEGDVEDGMFTARFNNASAERRTDVVRARAASLESRLGQLRTERDELLASSDGDPTVAQRAKAARLTARINAMQESINTTSAAAERAGVSTETLLQLRTEAADLVGPDVAALARSLAGIGHPRADTIGTRGDGDGVSVVGNTSVTIENSTDDKPSGPGAAQGQEQR